MTAWVTPRVMRPAGRRGLKARPIRISPTVTGFSRLAPRLARQSAVSQVSVQASGSGRAQGCGSTEAQEGAAPNRGADICVGRAHPRGQADRQPGQSRQPDAANHAQTPAGIHQEPPWKWNGRRTGRRGRSTASSARRPVNRSCGQGALSPLSGFVPRAARRGRRALPTGQQAVSLDEAARFELTVFAAPSMRCRPGRLRGAGEFAG